MDELDVRHGKCRKHPLEKNFFDTAGGGAYDTTLIRAILDTNVLVAVLRSSSGASHQILLAADRKYFEVALSVPLLAEYDDVLVRPSSGILIPRQEVEAIIGRIAQISHKQPIYFSGVRCFLIPRMAWSWNWPSHPERRTS